MVLLFATIGSIPFEVSGRLLKEVDGHIEVIGSGSLTFLNNLQAMTSRIEAICRENEEHGPIG
jgi:hypothetical protein